MTDARKVPGQAKRRPLHSHGSMLSLNPFGDNAEGTKGGNSDVLCVEEKGKAEGLMLEEELKVVLSGCVLRVLPCPLPLFRSSGQGSRGGFGKELPGPLPPRTQHSSQGRSSLVEARGFHRLGSAPAHYPTDHKSQHACGRPTGTLRGFGG